MKILFCSSEATPLIKTGGLADVAGSLPVALRSLGHDCRLILPAYPQAVANINNLETLAELELPGSSEPVRLLYGSTGPHETPVYLVDAPLYFNRLGNPYITPEGSNWPDTLTASASFAGLSRMSP